MKYNVTIHKEGVENTKKVIEAPSRFAVYEKVEKDGGTIVALMESKKGLHMPRWTSITIGTGIKQTEIITLARNLSAMLNAGLSLSRALSVLERQSKNKFYKRLITKLEEAIKKGSSFSDALAANPKIFSSLFIAMARAGEESGSLSGSLTIVAQQMERMHALIRKVRGAMIYPAVVVTAIIIVAILMLMFVVPTLTKTFASLGVALPLSTRIIVAISDFLVAYTVWVLPLFIAFFSALIMFVRSKTGGSMILWLALRTPVIGELVRETYSARAARTMSSLLMSGVPVLSALDITKDVVHAKVFANVIDEAKVYVKKGEPLSKAFIENNKYYPVFMGDMLAVGEETGGVAEMLKQVAEFYEEDVSEKTKDLSTVIEPILILIIGVFVGVFAVSMIGPIYSISSAI